MWEVKVSWPWHLYPPIELHRFKFFETREEAEAWASLFSEERYSVCILHYKVNSREAKEV